MITLNQLLEDSRINYISCAKLKRAIINARTLQLINVIEAVLIAISTNTHSPTDTWSVRLLRWVRPRCSDRMCPSICSTVSFHHRNCLTDDCKLAVRTMRTLLNLFTLECLRKLWRALWVPSAWASDLCRRIRGWRNRPDPSTSVWANPCRPFARKTSCFWFWNWIFPDVPLE